MVREPASELVVVKRLAGCPGDAVQGIDGVPVTLAPGQAWLTGDAPAAAIDSRRYGPVDVERLLGRVAWRYGPGRRFGPVR